LFAFSASPDIRTGLERLKLFKPLIAPVNLFLTEKDQTLTVRFEPLADVPEAFGATAAAEIVYFVEIMRSFTAQAITTVSVAIPDMRFATTAFRTFVGCPVYEEQDASLTISSKDALLPLISADTEFYAVIEKELLARLKLDKTGQTARDRVQRALVDILPSGQVSAETVCDYLGSSKRSLQRKLKAENTSFQSILDETRASLALTYLREQNLSAEEVSHLLAYKDPNSFYRAFQDWTGMTPAQARAERSD
jgi:AraC-like DNA-binding protein